MRPLGKDIPDGLHWFQGCTVCEYSEVPCECGSMEEWFCLQWYLWDAMCGMSDALVEFCLDAGVTDIVIDDSPPVLPDWLQEAVDKEGAER